MSSSLLMLAAAEKASILTVHPGLTFWTIVTFVVSAVVLRFTAWKPIVSMLQEREKTIHEAIEGAKRERLEAERLLAEQKTAITDARREAAELVRKNQAEVEVARQNALAQAKKDADALLEQARRAIAEERSKAVSELRFAAVDLAIAAAGKLLEVNLDEQKQRKLAEEFLQKIPTQPRA
ncbi:F0F1 ATP synthase subunit B [Vulgatibacter incomptus]|uniref:ATP synthase subunit b n=1 Tax=Vulgatibacter incomptus TaxID=1391653 RepID=A0A0K1PII3_9BACT|nr:F0F1 ATP synthase subunit B [Vulgatibacter incomptus]AKU92924.1 ATP synthase F0 sector subunit b [Vulgatibacter incomptus]